MAIQIAFVWHEACEKELVEMGFAKSTVYTKMVAGGGTTEEQKVAGDHEFFTMSNTPHQFVTTSWWGAGPE